jgi:predicted nucleic acid-binding protein
MTLVVDASAMVAALVDSGPDGRWAEGLLSSGLAAPHLLPVEVASVLRRAVHQGDLAVEIASLAHADLQDLRLELVPYGLVAERIWELHQNLSPYDAWYVAVAELLEVPLATLDQRLARAPGPTCTFRTPRE